MGKEGGKRVDEPVIDVDVFHTEGAYDYVNSLQFCRECGQLWGDHEAVDDGRNLHFRCR